jgi:hypothetical protein
MSRFDRINRRIGIGKFAYSTIQKTLEKNKITLQEMAKQMLNHGEEIQPIQTLINHVFEAQLKEKHITTLSCDFVARTGFVHNLIKHNK